MEDGTCHCVNPFTGRLCETAMGDTAITDPVRTTGEKTTAAKSTTKTPNGILSCKANPCQNGGICHGEDGSCRCNNGFMGKHCETAKKDNTAATITETAVDTRKMTTGLTTPAAAESKDHEVVGYNMHFRRCGLTTTRLDQR